MWKTPNFPSPALKRRIVDALADRRGVVGILFALAMPVLIGFTALGTEVGLWYLGRRNLQTAADVAAISAAFEILNGSGDETSSAEQEAARHGFDSSGGTIQVNNPPSAGTSTGDEDAVEVLLTQPRTPLFAGLFLAGSIDIAVRAVARMHATSTACVLALDPAAYRALDVVGTASLQMPGCVLAANSNNPEAISIRGNATVQALTLATSGDYDVSGSGTLVTETPPRTGATPLGNPYADRAIPTYGACDQTGYKRVSHTPVTISPGVYCDGMDFGSQAVVDFSPGTYVVNQGAFNVNGGATITCAGCTGSAGVTLVLTGSGTSYATVRINGGANVSLKAPTAGSYAGMLFFQDDDAPSGGSNIINGGATMNLTGALYFPSQSVDFNGNAASGGASCTQIVARTVSFSGTSNIGGDCDNSGTADINAGGTVNLVE
jgi:Flp pilus assembly protein TadG